MVKDLRTSVETGNTAAVLESDLGRFQHERYHRKPRQQMMRRHLRCLPEAVMRRQIAIAGTELGQPCRDQRVMLGFFGGDDDTMVIEGAWQRQVREPGNDVPGEID